MAPGTVKRAINRVIKFDVTWSYVKRQTAKMQGHPTSKLSKNPLRDISRLLVMFKDCLKSCFDQLEIFDLFGFLS